MVRHAAFVAWLALAAPAWAGDPVALHVPDPLIETGLMQYILPRFTLKTQVRVTLVDDPAQADLALGATGRALFEGAGRVWHLDVTARDAATTRFADWLSGEIGRNTVLAYAPDGTALFAPPPRPARAKATVTYDGDAELGHTVSVQKCTRCHAVDDATRFSGIGSTPSFAVLRSLDDWDARFGAFYALNPHPAFTIVEGVTPPFEDSRPPPIVPIALTLGELDAVLAYVARMAPAELGAPIRHQ